MTKTEDTRSEASDRSAVRKAYTLGATISSAVPSGGRDKNPDKRDLSKLQKETYEQRRAQTSHQQALNRKIAIAKKTLESKEQERNMAEMQIRRYQAQKRKLDEELEPLNAKKQALFTEAGRLKKTSDLTKVVSAILEQEDPLNFLDQVVSRFGRKLQSPTAPASENTPIKQEAKNEDQGRTPAEGMKPVTNSQQQSNHLQSGSSNGTPEILLTRDQLLPGSGTTTEDTPQGGQHAAAPLNTCGSSLATEIDNDSHR